MPPAISYAAVASPMGANAETEKLSRVPTRIQIVGFVISEVVFGADFAGSSPVPRSSDRPCASSGAIKKAGAEISSIGSMKDDEGMQANPSQGDHERGVTKVVKAQTLDMVSGGSARTNLTKAAHGIARNSLRCVSHTTSSSGRENEPAVRSVASTPLDRCRPLGRGIYTARDELQCCGARSRSPGSPKGAETRPAVLITTFEGEMRGAMPLVLSRIHTSQK